MISDVELDRMLTSWLSEGDDAAPADDVAAALREVAVTRQRRPLLSGVPKALSGWSGRRVLAMLAIVLLLVAATVVGIGSGLLQLDRELPPIQPAPAPSAEAVELREVRVVDFSSAILPIPQGWTELERPCCDSRLFGGTSPNGTLTIANENPYTAAVCDPECEQIDVAMSIPYSASDQVERLRAAVAASDDWASLPAGVLPDLEHGSQLETTAVVGGMEYRSRYITGLVERNIAAITWTQPVADWDASLLDRVLAGMSMPPAPQYTDGDLIDTGDTEGFSMPIPGVWRTLEQPTANGAPLPGVRREADGRIQVSIGRPDGTLGWCDPGCGTLSDASSLDALEQLVRQTAERDAGIVLGGSTDTVLGGETARLMRADEPSPRTYVVAIHGGRPVALLIDSGDWDVAPGIVDQMVAGFRFKDPVVELGENAHVVADGQIEVRLDDPWRPEPDKDGAFERPSNELDVRVGTDDGRIVTCDRPAAPWDLCREVQVTSLEELADAVKAAPIPDHGIGPPESVVDAGLLAGEPALIVRTQAYEHPARSGQEVAYVVAFHDGRPVIVRYWTGANQLRDLMNVIAGITFLD